ncbi:MAG TPA: hypothetical protein PK357_03555 [Candidatus Pacearchaeota archaeon]|nr:hypothetical protein [Candidatus Pacearchaeota archaeon]
MVNKEDINLGVKESIPKQETFKDENKILRNIFLSIGAFLLVIFLILFAINDFSLRTTGKAIGIGTNFEYKGVKFDMVKEGKLIFYHTSFPVIYNGSVNSYNIYLRNDPRDLEKKVPAKGTLTSLDDTVINITEEFDCNGDQVIAIANLVNLYNAIGVTLMRDETASCDPLGRYRYLTVQSGNSTNIEMVGPNCYNININNCEILEGTERFIVGMLVRINVEQTK